MENYSANSSRTTTAYVKVMTDAKDIAAKYGVKYIASEFLLAAILSANSNCSQTLKAYGITPVSYYKRLSDNIDVNYTKEGFTPRAKNMVNYSEQVAIESGCKFVAPEHLLYAILHTECVATDIVKAVCVDFKGLLREADTMVSDLSNMTATNVPPPRSSLGGGSPSFTASPAQYKPAAAKNVHTAAAQEEDEVLFRFGEDLTKKARLNQLDPVIGRDREIDRVIQTLSRRSKRNPLLIGEPGVGKSAVIEGLAQKIAGGDVPISLRNKTVFTLDMTGIMAGAKYKGEFEERFKAAINYVKERGDIILFVDEIHTIVYNGDSVGAGDILKPSLARGEIQVIGATTISEYRKHFEKDAALERRFQVIQLDPPRPDDCISILKGLRDNFEAHHGLEITDSAIKAAVYLSERYITDRFLPDKAIDLIDEAAAKERLLADTPPSTLFEKERLLNQLKLDKEYILSSGDDVRDVDEKINVLSGELEDLYKSEEKRRSHSKPFIDEDSVAKVISEMTGIPVAKLTEGESQKLLHLEEILGKRVIGQEAAINAVSTAMRRAVTCIKDPSKPIGSFIFVGPTGVGKTELSKALAEAMFGDENMIIRIDMSEYMERASVSKLIGAPPGYVGYDEEGQLTEKVRRKPYSVVLFDEIEKASPDVFNIMLQILDDGRLTDNKGRTVDFKNTIIIMTSNEGAAEVEVVNKIGFGDDVAVADDMKARIMTALKKKFKPEFLNRVDDIVVFRKLSREECGKIIDIQCEGLKKRMQSMHVTLRIEDSAKELLLEKGYNPEYGARQLKRTISNLVETPLSNLIIRREVCAGNTVTAISDDGEIDFMIG